MQTENQERSERSPRPDDSRWSALFAAELRHPFLMISMGVASDAAGAFLASTALPTAAMEIGGVDLLGWAFSVYFLAAIVTGFMGGNLQARLGWRLSLYASATVFLLGALTISSASSMIAVLVGRTLQGAGHGAIAAICYGLVPVFFPRPFVPKVIAAESIVWAAAAFAGPAVAGLLADYASWRLAFVVNLPILLAFISLVVVCTNEPPSTPSTSAWQDAVVLLRFFSPRTTVGAGLWVVLLMTIATGSVSAFLVLTIHALWDYGAAPAGYAHALLTLSWGLFAVLVAHARLRRFASAFLRLGPALVLLGLTCILLGVRFDLPALILVAQTTIGAGFGVSWGYLNEFVMAAAPDENRSQAATLLPTAHSAGLVAGTAIAALVAQAAGVADAGSDEFRSAIEWVFAAGLLFAAAGWLFSRSIAHPAPSRW